MQRKSENKRKILIEQYRESGLSVRVFCLDEGLTEQTLRNWIGMAHKSQNIHQGFVEVSSGFEVSYRRASERCPEKTFLQTYGVLLNFPHGVSIEVFPDTDRDTVT